MQLLVDSFNPAAAEGLMCRDTLSVGWDGRWVLGCRPLQSRPPACLRACLRRRTRWQIQHIVPAACLCDRVFLSVSAVHSVTLTPATQFPASSAGSTTATSISSWSWGW